jgi:adenylate kinase
MRKIILVGRSCSGKSRLLENLLKLGMRFDVISPGDIFRAEKKKNSSLWKKIKKFIDVGLNAPDELVNEIVSKRLHHEHTGQLQFLDGFPRTKNQIEVLFEVPAKYFVVHVDTPEEVCRERFRSRGRHDDHNEAFDNKMKVYEKEVVPVLNFLRGAFGTVVIDGRYTDLQYAKVVDYCSLHDHICVSRADASVLEEYRLWQMYHPG